MLDNPAQNKMMESAPNKKEFFFSGSGVHFAKTIFAETIEEAEKIWHQTKQLIYPAPMSTPSTTTTAEPKPEPTSTTGPKTEEINK